MNVYKAAEILGNSETTIYRHLPNTSAQRDGREWIVTDQVLDELRELIAPGGQCHGKGVGISLNGTKGSKPKAGDDAWLRTCKRALDNIAAARAEETGDPSDDWRAVYAGLLD